MLRLKMNELQIHLQKLNKCKSQRDALSEQIRIKNQIVSQQEKPFMSENPHARSESLMVLYKKEKAKQLYQEQLQLMKQKRNYEAKIAEMDKQHSLERLVLARKEQVFVNFK